jgi:hypothetical protein
LIGPLLRTRRLLPRSSANPPGLRRRVRNKLTDLLQYFVEPFADWENERLVTERVEVRIDGLGAAFDGYRIAFLTDLHISPLVPRWWLDRAVRAALALEPNLIVLGGDYVDDDPHYVHKVAEVLKPLRAPDGVVGVLGNHDHYVDAQGVREQLAKAGVRELLNEPMVMTRGGSQLAITRVFMAMRLDGGNLNDKLGGNARTFAGLVHALSEGCRCGAAAARSPGWPAVTESREAEELREEGS